jgi:20S proteasome alpha/beta subunit
MTQIIGIICPDGIVMASDSQFTDLNTGIVSYGDKIHEASFKSAGSDFLIAEAGQPAITNRVVRIIGNAARKLQAENVVSIAEHAVRQLRGESTDKQWDIGSQGGGATLMVGFYENRKPYIYLGHIYGHGIFSEPENKHYAAYGIGTVLVEYLLSEFLDKTATTHVAAVTAIYVLAKVKKHTKAYCGGDTRINILTIDPGIWPVQVVKAGYVSQTVVNRTEELLLQRDKEINKDQNQKWLTVMAEIAGEEFRKLLKSEQDQQDEWRKQAAINNPVTGICGQSTVFEANTPENKGEK